MNDHSCTTAFGYVASSAGVTVCVHIDDGLLLCTARLFCGWLLLVRTRLVRLFPEDGDTSPQFHSGVAGVDNRIREKRSPPPLASMFEKICRSSGF
jgi:hypothetical protein